MSTHYCWSTRRARRPCWMVGQPASPARERQRGPERRLPATADCMDRVLLLHLPHAHSNPVPDPSMLPGRDSPSGPRRLLSTSIRCSSSTSGESISTFRLTTASATWSLKSETTRCRLSRRAYCSVATYGSSAGRLAASEHSSAHATYAAGSSASWRSKAARACGHSVSGASFLTEAGSSAYHP